MESILISIKQLLGLGEDYTPFDPEVIMHINSVLMILNQYGYGPEDGFAICGDEETWTDFLGEIKKKKFEAVKTYVYLKVKIVFDPPANASHLQALKDQAAEYDWRLKEQRELNRG